MLVLPNNGRLVLVSNRLPVTIRRTEDGRFTYHSSNGGLVSGLSGLLKDRPFLWYGWPGLNIPEHDKPSFEMDLREKYSAVPIWIDEQLGDLHYNGFSNTVLWPLMHHRPGAPFDANTWSAYLQVNRLFAKAISKTIRDGDIIWVHDYHLMLLPEFIRAELHERCKSCPKSRIGFFLHTPFPPAEIFDQLVVKRDVLRGLLSCDLVGFHTDEYARHFLRSCSMIPGAVTETQSIIFHDRVVKVSALPIGIDSSRIERSLQKNSVRQNIVKLKAHFRGQKIIIGIDRLDFIKGIPQKLEAFELFLRIYPEWIGQACLVQIMVPSRERLEENQDLKYRIDLLAKGINEKYRSLGHTPVRIMHKDVGFDELFAFYSAADACVISSTRDGMNLVSHEYVASQANNKGVLILSQFTGAAGVLVDSLQVNPSDTMEFARTYMKALVMSSEERTKRWEAMHEHVSRNTSTAWGEAFIQELEKGCPLTERRRSDAGFAGKDIYEFYAS